MGKGKKDNQHTGTRTTASPKSISAGNNAGPSNKRKVLTSGKKND